MTDHDCDYAGDRACPFVPTLQTTIAGKLMSFRAFPGDAKVLVCHPRKALKLWAEVDRIDYRTDQKPRIRLIDPTVPGLPEGADQIRQAAVAFYRQHHRSLLSLPPLARIDHPGWRTRRT